MSSSSARRARQRLDRPRSQTLKGLLATLELLGLLLVAFIVPSRSGLRGVGRELDDRIVDAESTAGPGEP